MQISREGWYSAIMAPIFVASAMDSGLALLLISLVALEKAKLIKLGRDLMASLAGLLATCIAVDAFFIGCEVLTVAYPQTAGGAQLLGEMFSGATAPFFWFEVAAGLIVPFCILVFAKNRQRTGLVMGASVLVVLGVLCKRIWLLFTSFIHPNMAGAPGISSGSSVAAHSSGIDIWSTARVLCSDTGRDSRGAWRHIPCKPGLSCFGIEADRGRGGRGFNGGGQRSPSFLTAWCDILVTYFLCF